jgi:FkbM family methyltransferase
VLWALLLPIRLYVRYAPTVRTKGFLIHNVILRALPSAETTFLWRLPGGGKARLHYRENLGWTVLLTGGFEMVELAYLMEATIPGTVVFDVGANVGLFTIALARRVGPNGRVFSMEPLPGNVDRLREHIEMNGLHNVIILDAAAADRTGEVIFYPGTDNVFGSTVFRDLRSRSEFSIKVPGVTLDDVWSDAGSPRVTIIKIDVEGAEMQVLKGVSKLVTACTPLLMVEISNHRHFSAFQAWASENNYAHIHPAGFSPHNHIFAPCDLAAQQIELGSKQ